MGNDFGGCELQSAATFGDGASWTTGARFKNFTFVSAFGAGAAAGVVSYEHAADIAYAGTWAVLGTENFGDGLARSQSFEGVLRAVRARITTPITIGAAKTITAIDLRLKTITGIDLRTKAISAIDLRTKAITGITAASPAVFTCTGHGFTTGDSIKIAGVVGTMGAVVNTTAILTEGADANHFTAAFDTTGLTYTSGGLVNKVGDTPIVTTATHGYSTGNTVTLSGIVGTTQLNGHSGVVTVIDTTHFSLDGVDGSAYTAYASGGVALKSTDYPIVTMTETHGYANGDTVYLSGIVGTTELNGNSYTVAATATKTIQLSGVVGTSLSAYSSGGTVYRTARAAQAITAISKAMPAVITSAAHGYSTGDTVTVNAGDMVEIPTGDYLITRLTADTFSIPYSSVGATTYTTGGTALKTAVNTFDYPELTATAHGFLDGDSIYITGVGGTVELVTGVYTVINKGTNTFQLVGLDPSLWTAFTSGGTARTCTDVTVTVTAN